MKKSILLVLATLTAINAAQGTPKTTRPIKQLPPTIVAPIKPYRGWDYLAKRLQEQGVEEQIIRKLYADTRMPVRTFVPFSLAPKEPASIYAGFLKERFSRLGADFIRQNKPTFDAMHRTYRVPPEIVASIIVIESQAGRYTGKHPILYRLSRIATTNAPDNLQKNFHEHRRNDASVTFEQVAARGLYLEQTFLPEIIALVDIAKRNSVDPLTMKGSRAGAFGLPQFLPTTFLRFGIDGNKDGIVTLHNEIDAVWSTAHFLSHLGLKDETPEEEKRKILWHYNKSHNYIDTVLKLSKRINKALQ